MSVSLVVIFCLVLSCFELIGFLWWADLTICGVSTIYVVMCLGLAVDYAAHIGHVFCLELGKAAKELQEASPNQLSSEKTGFSLAFQALFRIGPSVFNAIITTLITAIVLSPSNPKLI
jgi:predicted RND superfamily exporter protein